MERLSCSPEAPYQPVEAAIHVARYAPALGICAGKRVLDIACGEGYGSFLLAQAGAAAVLGVDVSAEAVVAAESQFQHPALRYLAADAATADHVLGDERYDLIISLETIEHLQDPVRFLQAISRLRAEGGSILISCPNDHWYYTAEQSNPYHTRKYHFAEFRDLAEQVLGPAGAWFFGTPAIGFTTVPLIGLEPGRNGRDYARPLPLHAGFLCPPGEMDGVSAERSSYFFGAWGPAAARMLSGAYFPVSMNRYAALMWEHERDARQAQQQLEAERSHWLTAASTHSAQLEALKRSLGQVRTELTQERSHARVQANALRQENDILAESVATMRKREAAAHADRESIARERAILAAEHERLIEQMRPLWRVAAMIPKPIRRVARRTAGWLLRLTAPRS